MRKKYKAIKIYGKKIDYHRFIMEKHIGRKLCRNELVHHINGDTLDNRIENLKIVTPVEHYNEHRELYEASMHSRDARKKVGEFQKKFQRSKSSINIDIANKIRCEYTQGLSLRVLGLKYSLHWTTIQKIVKNRTWI